MEDWFYTKKGEGVPVVLIHGFCESHIIWNHLSEHLSTSFQVICPDLPGFGKSKPLDNDNFSLEDISSSLKDWLDHIGIKKCIMIGHSLGGYVTLAFARKYPQRLLGLGLFHSTCYADSLEKKETRNKVISFLESHGANEFTDTFIPGLFYHKSGQIQMDIQTLVEDARSCNKESLIAYTRAMRERADSTHMMNIDLPILFIAGENDGAVPVETSIAQTQNLDPEYVHILKETGHMGMFERKSETSKMVMDYLVQFK